MDNEYRGKLTGISLDVVSREVNINFAVKADLAYAQEHFPELIGKDMKIGFEEWQEKRSLNANAYFHVLCRKIAQVTKQSETYVKNDMIASYGQPELMENGEYWTIHSNMDFVQLWEHETPHVKFSDVHIQDGNIMYEYVVMRGVATYTKKEMSRLIEHTAYEAKDLGIETLPPEELNRMMNSWRPNEKCNPKR